MAASDIQTNSLKPKSASVDGNSASQFSIAEQIAAERFAQSEEQKTGKKQGFRLAQFRNQGTQ